ncbi:MAG: hypothetical protein IJC89_02090 [Clostridia bacterium]|nr:hypothetical protein [Clostridia bacterium]
MKKHINKFINAILCASLMLCFCSCTQKNLGIYNIPVKGVLYDSADTDSVIYNAIMAESYGIVGENCRAVVAAYKEIANTEVKGDKHIFYLLASIGGYSFINGKLTRSDGYPPYGVVITLQEKEGKFTVMGYKSSRDINLPADKAKFIQDNMPGIENGHTVMNNNREILFNMEERKIEQDNMISVDFQFAQEEDSVEMLPISDTAYSSVNRYFLDYPDWIGSTEKKHKDVFHTYRTLFTPEGIENPGNGILEFIHTNEKGDVVEHIYIKVTGDHTEKISI